MEFSLSGGASKTGAESEKKTIEFKGVPKLEE